MIAVAWTGKFLWCVLRAAILRIRSPYRRISQVLPVLQTQVSRTERLLVLLTRCCFAYLPWAYVLGALLLQARSGRSRVFGDYAGSWVMLAAGALAAVPGLWLFHRSHADLGRNWSITLELREAHTLVTQGVYGRLRHPMYASAFLLHAASALWLHNWLVGPAGLLSFLLHYALRVRREEEMLLEHFGREYKDYMARTPRLVPRVFEKRAPEPPDVDTTGASG